MGASRGVRVRNIGYHRITREFASNWVVRTFGLVLN